MFNFLDEISEKTPEETGLYISWKIDDEELYKKFAKCSVTFADYYKLYNLFNNFIRDTNVVYKRQFADKWLKGVFSKRDANGKLPFGRDFCVNFKYDENAFDLFFSIMRDNIKKLFLDITCSIFRELKNVTEGIAKRKNGIILEGLSDQYYMLKVKGYKKTIEEFKKCTLKEIGCIEKYFDKKVEVVYLKERTACLDRLRQI